MIIVLGNEGRGFDKGPTDSILFLVDGFEYQFALGDTLYWPRSLYWSVLFGHWSSLTQRRLLHTTYTHQ